MKPTRGACELTLSIIARCARSGQLGVAAATEMPAVGKLLSYALPDAGAVATQATVNPYLGIDGIRFLSEGAGAREALERVLATDPDADERQVAMIDRHGVTAVWTGPACPHWTGSQEGAGFSVQGNRLEGPHVLEAMARAFEELADKELVVRLSAALAAGIAVGGDRLGERSANVLVVDEEEYPLWDIRVDDHDDPMGELVRLERLFREELLPHIRKMPGRNRRGGSDRDFAV